MIRMILDTDLAMGAPGSDIDDGFALAYVLADPNIRLEAVTTVNGNTDVQSATLLACELLEQLGRSDIPVHKGAELPLTKDLQETAARGRASNVSQQYGHHKWAPGHAVDELVRIVKENPGEITIAAIGPVTNIALALRIAPEIAPLIKELVIMGGVFLEHTNDAEMPGEFNIWVDPDAASIVVNSEIRPRFVGLDVTRQVRLSLADANELREAESSFARFAGEHTSAWIEYVAAKNPGDPAEQNSCAMHDPLAVAAVTSRDLIEWKPAYVQFESQSPLTRGVAVADFLTGSKPPAPNCDVAVAVDASRFNRLFLDRIKTL